MRIGFSFISKYVSGSALCLSNVAGLLYVSFIYVHLYLSLVATLEWYLKISLKERRNDTLDQEP